MLSNVFRAHRVLWHRQEDYQLRIASNIARGSARAEFDNWQTVAWWPIPPTDKLHLSVFPFASFCQWNFIDCSFRTISSIKKSKGIEIQLKKATSKLWSNRLDQWWASIQRQNNFGLGYSIWIIYIKNNKAIKTICHLKCMTLRKLAWFIQTFHLNKQPSINNLVLLGGYGWRHRRQSGRGNKHNLLKNYLVAVINIIILMTTIKPRGPSSQLGRSQGLDSISISISILLIFKALC